MPPARDVASGGKRLPTSAAPTHFAAWHPIEGDEIGQLRYTICSCGWRSSLARRWSGYGQWRDHVSELGKQGEERLDE
jgi:hypothetical protein